MSVNKCQKARKAPKQKSITERERHVQQVLKSILTSFSNNSVTVNELEKKYIDQEKENVPYIEFGFNSFISYLWSISTGIKLEKLDNTYIVRHVDLMNSSKVDSPVSQQTKGPVNKKKNRNTRTRKTPQRKISADILNRLLERAKTNYEGMGKAYLLKCVNDTVPGISFTMDDLNRQLWEYTREFVINDDRIYYKFNHCQKITKSDKSSVYECDSVPQIVKNRLEKVIESFPEGIFASELPKKYFEAFNIELNYKELGFNNIPELVNILPDIFTSVFRSSRMLLLNANNPIPDLNDSQESNIPSLNNVKEEVRIESEALPAELSPTILNKFIPAGTMGCDDNVGQIKVTSLKRKLGEFEELIVSEIFDPSFFWVQLRKYKADLENLMKTLHKYYERIDESKYKIPQIALKVGLNVACLFDYKWHRAIVKKIKADGRVVLFFYDFGTVMVYNPAALYFLDKMFAKIPAQAIPCGLTNIRPYKAKRWSYDSFTAFTKFVMGRELIGMISSIDADHNSMMIYLLDTSEPEDVNINMWLVEKEYAERGQMRETVPVQHLCHYDYFQSEEEEEEDKAVTSESKESLNNGTYDPQDVTRIVKLNQLLSQENEELKRQVEELKRQVEEKKKCQKNLENQMKACNIKNSTNEEIIPNDLQRNEETTDRIQSQINGDQLNDALQSAPETNDKFENEQILDSDNACGYSTIDPNYLNIDVSYDEIDEDFYAFDLAGEIDVNNCNQALDNVDFEENDGTIEIVYKCTAANAEPDFECSKEKAAPICNFDPVPSGRRIDSSNVCVESGPVKYDIKDTVNDMCEQLKNSHIKDSKDKSVTSSSKTDSRVIPKEKTRQNRRKKSHKKHTKC